MTTIILFAIVIGVILMARTAGVFFLAFAFLVFLMAGCAPVDPIVREYDRVEWVETVFKPSVDKCRAEGGRLVYDGPSSLRMRRILKTENWSMLHRTDWNYFRCNTR